MVATSNLPQQWALGIPDVAVMDAQAATTRPASLLARLRAKLTGAGGGTSEASLTRRLAGTIFIIRVVSAGLAYLPDMGSRVKWLDGEAGILNALGLGRKTTELSGRRRSISRARRASG